jgi:uncharacterized protein YaiE (UPF0345 family)
VVVDTPIRVARLTQPAASDSSTQGALVDDPGDIEAGSGSLVEVALDGTPGVAAEEGVPPEPESESEPVVVFGGFQPEGEPEPEPEPVEGPESAVVAPESAVLAAAKIGSAVAGAYKLGVGAMERAKIIDGAYVFRLSAENVVVVRWRNMLNSHHCHFRVSLRVHVPLRVRKCFRGKGYL